MTDLARARKARAVFDYGVVEVGEAADWPPASTEFVALAPKAPYIGPEDAFVSERAAKKLPYLRFLCGRAPDLGPRQYRVGLYWYPNPSGPRRCDPYRRGVEVTFALRLRFHRF